MPTDRPPRSIAITCSGGTGTGILNSMGGHMEDIGILAPSASTVYDIELTDIDGYGMGGETGITGNATLKLDIDAWNQVTITIANSTSPSGTFNIKIWFTQNY